MEPVHRRQAYRVAKYLVIWLTSKPVNVLSRNYYSQRPGHSQIYLEHFLHSVFLSSKPLCSKRNRWPCISGFISSHDICFMIHINALTWPLKYSIFVFLFIREELLFYKLTVRFLSFVSSSTIPQSFQHVNRKPVQTVSARCVPVKCNAHSLTAWIQTYFCGKKS